MPDGLVCFFFVAMDVNLKIPLKTANARRWEERRAKLVNRELGGNLCFGTTKQLGRRCYLTVMLDC